MTALRVVLVGYGPVGARFVEELLPAVLSGSIELTVVAGEDVEAYNRVLVAEYAVGNSEIGKYERAKIAERSRRGKLRKAREGKVMAGPRVKYGFRLNDARDGLLVDEEKMRIVRRIFRMVGAEGYSLSAVYKTFEREWIPTPGGGKRWDRAFFRIAILDDVYRPHTYEEAAELVSPEVAARLDFK